MIDSKEMLNSFVDKRISSKNDELDEFLTIVDEGFDNDKEAYDDYDELLSFIDDEDLI